MSFLNSTMAAIILNVIAFTLSVTRSGAYSQASPDRARGQLIMSTDGTFTVIAGADRYSYTATGGPCNGNDGLSATSVDDNCTLTLEMGNWTAFDTTLNG